MRPPAAGVDASAAAVAAGVGGRGVGVEGVAVVRALVWTGPRALSLQEVPAPRPGPDEALLRPLAVGICGSELSGYLGENSLRRPPLIMGHEFCAVVEEAPPGSPYGPGSLVVVNPLLSCGVCALCRRGARNLCPERRIIGAGRPGAFAALLAVPVSACHPAPAGVEPRLAAMAEPLACALRAVEQAGTGPGEGVLILGAGAIGLLTLAVLRHAGAGAVWVADPNPHRLETARAWGGIPLPGPEPELRAELGRCTGGLGVDVAVDAVGLTATRRLALRAVRPGGRVVFVGLHEPESMLPINEIVRGETAVSGCFCYRDDTFRRALTLLREGLLPDGPWQREGPLEDGPAAFEELLAGGAAPSKVVLRP